jgi:DNA-binding MarR family transcriptional regulator
MADPKRARRIALTVEVNQALRRVNAQLVLLSDTVARCVGLHPTDLQCLDLLRLSGPTTASTLAARVGLTTGAMTAVIDRLENTGLVRRARTADDRRCVLVHVIAPRVKPIEALYKPLADRLAHLDRAFSDEQLATVLAYLKSTLEACAEHVSRMQGLAKAGRDAVGRRGRLPRTGKAARPKTLSVPQVRHAAGDR